MIEAEKNFRSAAVKQVAQLMALAARTAPKAKGLDLLEIVVISGEEVARLSAKMTEIGDREKHPTFLRDAENIRQAQAILLLGSRRQSVGLKYCSFCGWPNCAESEKAGAICAHNSGDLGIAVGSAVAVASNHHLDNRIMYTVGKAALEMGLLGEAVIAYGIPLSVSAKNPFFDRK
jgi:uncharacterized ferredoxin-like protein